MDVLCMQAGETLTICVSLRPTVGMVSSLQQKCRPPSLPSTADNASKASVCCCSLSGTDCAPEHEALHGRSSSIRGSCEYEIPISVSVPGQPLPVKVTLCFTPTSASIELAPSLLELGQVPLGEAVIARVELHNTSLLPQAYAFGPNLPRGLQFQQGAGYGRLQPRERRVLTLALAPSLPGQQLLEVACRSTGAGGAAAARLRMRVEGLQHDLELSHNAIKARGMGNQLCFFIIYLKPGMHKGIHTTDAAAYLLFAAARNSNGRRGKSINNASQSQHCHCLCVRVHFAT